MSGAGIIILRVIRRHFLAAAVDPAVSPLMTHKYRGSIIVHSISKSVEPNEEQKEMISGFQQGILCKY